ncbi:hypothetical protein I4Q36_02755 [Tuanshanicoccus lijuaniae]|uniref:hypothetical protein n=1 Tax=Aerococcaceae bacterium zg-1292 TaxID=2774330 RepID=UPI001935B340|nr:hypothetical protein [Aerococcaceae bacterium zg-1292]MBF6626191.1 hypothetical protein [Aerococcaceae bacterium zg-BR9]MBS4456077.1 hypothetical protein [Aerococcaceae bacterium zg-A91]MBS4457829.1 hypothetical protein [Aerococcaceae bacterium zg-BR33]QQA37654.1 hypothetical protein I4Q36_02755 [Aerococcaceae bacterium zg-1292]
MLRVTGYNLWLNLKRILFWCAISLCVLISILMAFTDIKIGLMHRLRQPILYYVFVAITTEFSTSLLMLIHSFPSIQSFVTAQQSNQLLLLQHRLGHGRYFIQLYLSNCLTSFFVGTGFCTAYILLLSLRFPFVGDDNQMLANAVSGGQWLLEGQAFWTYGYYILLLGLSFAFYQLLATFLTVLFPHETMCYLYTMISWVVLNYNTFSEKIPFYLSPHTIFAMDNSFYDATQWSGISLPMWYPFLYFLIVFIVIVGLSLMWVSIKRRWR